MRYVQLVEDFEAAVKAWEDDPDDPKVEIHYLETKRALLEGLANAKLSRQREMSTRD